MGEDVDAGGESWKDMDRCWLREDVGGCGKLWEDVVSCVGG